jgi:hypothetical protein
MMRLASSPDFIPEDIHSKKGSHCNKEMMIKI